jgi:acyl-CoA synthetase (AMP-forming)/AMP-acid ligase II
MDYGTEAVTIPKIIHFHRAHAPDAPALRALDETDMPFADLAELCSSSASALAAMDLGAGDSIAIVLPNGPIMATAFLAVTHLATAAPLNPGLKEAEFAFYLEDLQARAVIVNGTGRDTGVGGSSIIRHFDNSNPTRGRRACRIVLIRRRA